TPVDDPHARLGARPDGHDRDVRIGADGVVLIPEHTRTARFWFKTRVTPFRCYRLEVRIRARGETGAPAVRVLADDEPVHLSAGFDARAARDWTTYRVVFNSLDHTRATIDFGDWRPARGTLEWRDWTIAASGPVNVLRRASAPIAIVRGAEGRDI